MLTLDSGNFSDNPTPQGDVKTQGLLQEMERMGYSVVNVGERDVRLGYESFAQRTKGSGLQFISANIVSGEAREPVFAPHTVVEAVSVDGATKLRVGVIGVVRFNPIFKKQGPGGEEMLIVHPLARVKEEIAKVEAKGVDVVVLLAALHRDDAKRIVSQVPGIDFVIGAYGGVYTNGKEREGDTWIVYTGNQGKRVAVTRAYMDAGANVTDQTTRMHYLTRAYPANPEMLEAVNAIHERVSARRQATAAAAGSAGSETKFIGTSACQTCHPSAFEQWETTRHAHALRTLEEAEGGMEAGCVSCHVTGLDKAGGFKDRGTTPHLANVGCESCHGAGARHAVSPLEGYGKVKLAVCVGCHNLENSPKFDYYSYLPKVTHVDRAVK